MHDDDLTVYVETVYVKLMIDQRYSDKIGIVQRYGLVLSKGISTHLKDLPLV